MSRRITGISFVAVAAFLYATRFFAAAIWGSSFNTWNAENFSHLLGYVDQGLTTWSIVALIIGLIYLLWAEISEMRG